MLLLTGPPGSGKSHFILEHLRSLLRRGASDFRLIVPTTTMAGHLRNQMAREGFRVRPGSILTLSRFVDPWVRDIPQMTPVELDLLVRKALAANCPPEFAATAGKRGFRELAARLIDEVSSAGYDSRQLAKALGGAPADAPLAPAFLRLYEDVEKEICLHRSMLGSARIRRAGDEVRSRGLGPIHRVFFDGFYAFGHPELALIRSIRSHADVTVALPKWAGASVARSALLAMGLQEIEFDTTVHRFPMRHVVTAPGIEREAAEVARRILDHAAAGRQFREMGIVLRSREPYVPVLRAALERHGIPARFYFSEPVAQHAMVRYLTGAVEAMLGAWKHEQLLPILKMAASGFGNTAAGDRFDFEVRKQLPGFGLGPLRRLSDHPRLGALLDRLCGLEAWTAARAIPSEWAFRVRGLRCLVQLSEVTDGVSHETAALWRAQVRALDAFAAATDEAASALPDRLPIPFADYWEAFTTVLENAGLRVPDARRNVVNVMDVYEARQWELPVVFVCGLIEKHFPRYASADPILPEAARARLQAGDVRLKTAADQRDEEAFLFEIATTRATSELVLSYPEHDEKGDPNLPSFFLDEFGLEPERCGAAPGGSIVPEPEREPYLRDPALLTVLGVRHEVVKPSAIEAFLQCPFRFFLDHTLGLEPPPALPRARLDARVEGSIVHQTLAEWQRDGESIGDVFERVFRDVCACRNVPPGCRTELARIRLLRDLRRFLSESRRLEGWGIAVEETIEFALDDIIVRGRIDRYDVSPDNRAVVFDYKYSREEGIRRRMRGYDEGRCVQGALYLLGLERVRGLEPAGLFYCGLKKDVTLNGWHACLPEFHGKGTACTPQVLRERLDAAAAITIDAAREIRRGRVEPWPANRDQCDYCNYLDVCRVGPPAEAVAAEGAGE